MTATKLWTFILIANSYLQLVGPEYFVLYSTFHAAVQTKCTQLVFGDLQSKVKETRILLRRDFLFTSFLRNGFFPPKNSEKMYKRIKKYLFFHCFLLFTFYFLLSLVRSPFHPHLQCNSYLSTRKNEWIINYYINVTLWNFMDRLHVWYHAHIADAILCVISCTILCPPPAVDTTVLTTCNRTQNRT
jgi:hypothetical protein